jgi:hypothetical protein
MEQTEDQHLPVLINCENCSTQLLDSVKFCNSCSFPVAGSEEDKRNFRLSVGSKRRQVKDAEEKIKSCKTVIYILAGILFITALVVGFTQDDYVAMIVNLCISLLYLILAAWSEKNPFGAILTAFIIYVTLILINFFVDPTTLFSGLLFKILFIGAFVKGVRSAKEAKDILEELEKTKSL